MSMWSVLQTSCIRACSRGTLAVNVLLLTQVLPYPPDSGPKVKTYNVLKYLAGRHSVTLVSFVRGDQSAQVRRLERLCRAVYTVPMDRSKWREPLYGLRSLWRGDPFVMTRDHRARMHALIARLHADQRFGVVHADQHNMAQYAERVEGAFKVLDAHNALWLLYKRQWETTTPGPYRWLLNRDWRLFRRYEARICREFDAVLAVTEVDKKALLEVLDRPREITVIPIAVDTEEVRLIERVPGPSHILHIGTMFWPPNADGVRWFIRQVLPIVRAQRPDIVFDVVGSRPPRDLVALGEKLPYLNVTGYVEDPLPYQQQAALMVVPLLAGGGMRVKILNALAEGIPIASTTLGYEGIELNPSHDLLVGDTPEAFAAQVLRVLNDPDLGRQMAVNGRRTVEGRYDYRDVCRPLDDVYASVASVQGDEDAPAHTARS